MENTEKDWEIFVTIAEQKNITKAAQVLFMTQPALSYRLAQMEKSFDEPLLIRTTKGVLLTEAGDLYYHYAQDMIKRKREFEASLAEKKSTVTGTLYLGSSSIFATYELPAILAGFTKTYPEVKLNLRTGISTEIARLFSNDDIQIAIIRGDHGNLGEKKSLYTDPICLVTSKDCNRQTLPTVPQIRYATDPSLYTVMDTWWKENYKTPANTSIFLDNMAICRRFIQKNLGWSLLPSTGLAQFSHDFYIEKLFWADGTPIVRETNLYVHPRKTQRKVVQVFIDYIIKYMNTTPLSLPHL